MPGKYFNLDTDILLGGENSSDIFIASQKAVKAYIDSNLSDKADKTEIPTDYVPNTLTINNKTLNEDIILTADDVGALSVDTAIPVITDIYSSTSTDGMSGIALASALDSYVPKTRTISGHDLSEDIVLTAKDVATMEGYTIGEVSENIVETDTLNEAIGKLEYKIENVGSPKFLTVGMLAGIEDEEEDPTENEEGNDTPPLVIPEENEEKPTLDPTI